MHITVEPYDSHAILHLRGEFDTYYCPMLWEEIASLSKHINFVVLNLRLVKFLSRELGRRVRIQSGVPSKEKLLVIS